MLCVLEELLQLYAIVLFGVVVIRIVDRIKIAIPLISTKRFMLFVVILVNINIHSKFRLINSTIYLQKYQPGL